MAAAVFAAAFLPACAAQLDPARIADAQTAARVKTVLVNDPAVGGLPIEVRVAGGVVTLLGRVPTADDVDRLVALARAVPGVSGVASNLLVGAEPDPPAAPPAPTKEGARRTQEYDARPTLFAAGLSAGWSIPGRSRFKSRVAISPLLKVGASRGLGLAIGLDWFKADVQSIGGPETLAEVTIRPVMAGLGYSLVDRRLTLTPSVVAGYSFNSLTVTDTGLARGLPVEVGNSFAWRVGVSAWFDATRRVAVNVSTGYLMTGLRLTVLENGRLEHRDASGDTTILHVGLAYRVF